VFPPWVLLLHWLAVLFGGAAFLIGYAMRARATPVVMTIARGLRAGDVRLPATRRPIPRHSRSKNGVASLAYGAGVCGLSLVALLFKLPSLQARFADA
jgi:hypothetical protein